MVSESPIVIALNRAFNDGDEKAISRLMSQWLVYDVKIRRNRIGAEIKLFHSTGAKPDLLKEISALFPGEHLTGM
jgi:hypothetical protein